MALRPGNTNTWPDRGRQGGRGVSRPKRRRSSAGDDPSGRQVGTGNSGPDILSVRVVTSTHSMLERYRHELRASLLDLWPALLLGLALARLLHVSLPK